MSQLALFLSPLPLWGWLVLAFFLGSLPFSVWVGRARKVDPRRGGSKNPGASNLGRLAGRRWGLLALLLDGGKGALVVGLSLHALELTESCLVGATAIVGHCFSPLLGFQGGRGVATTLGVFSVLDPPAALLAGLFWPPVTVLSRRAAFGSLTMVFTLVVITRRSGQPLAPHLLSIAVAILITVRHWEHIRRLFFSPRR